MARVCVCFPHCWLSRILTIPGTKLALKNYLSNECTASASVSYWKQRIGSWYLINMFFRMEFWDAWVFKMIDYGIPSRSLATIISLGSSGSIRKQRLLKEIQVEVGRLGQLLLYFQEAMTLVFVFLLFLLYVKHKWNISSPRGFIHSYNVSSHCYISSPSLLLLNIDL